MVNGRTKRRSVMLGLGALATGSGAVFASGAFDSAFTDPSADLRVIADGQISVRGNAEDDDNVYNLGGDDEHPEAIDFGDEDVRDMLPRATFAHTPADADDTNGNFNDDIQLTVGIELRENGTFEKLLKIDNRTGITQDVTIHFEENTEAGEAEDNETYGADVGEQGISKQTVQRIYQFTEQEEETLLSPDPTGDSTADIGDNVSTENKGANQVPIGPGETLSVNLDFDTTDGEIIGAINSAGRGEKFGGPAEFSQDLRLLDGIVIQAVDADGEEA